MSPFPSLLTAMATPFTDDGGLDLDGAQTLAAHLVDHGSGGIIVTGTTGEAPTLSHAEAVDVALVVAEAVGDRATVMAGMGTYDTRADVEVVRELHTTGVSGILLGSPYYNRPSQAGLVAHFSTVAAATELPVMLYNIPARTATEIEPATLLALATDVPNIVAVKDAVGDMAKASWLAARAPADFGIWSGDDKNFLPLMAVGGAGVVSVAAHLVGEHLAAMIDAFPTDPVAARTIHLKMGPIFEALFCEPSPAPLKWAMAQLGLPSGTVRSPMVPLTPAGQAIVADAMRAVGLAPS